MPKPSLSMPTELAFLHFGEVAPEQAVMRVTLPLPEGGAGFPRLSPGFIAQSICEMDVPVRVYLVRVVVDVRDDRAEVVTAYRSTRIARCWRGAS